MSTAGENLEELIRLLDRDLYFRGHTGTIDGVGILPPAISRRDRRQQVKTALHEDVPSSVQLFPEVSLEQHLRELDQEKLEHADVSTRIATHLLSSGLRYATHAKLDAELFSLDPTISTFELREQSLGEKLHKIRRLQYERDHPRQQTFHISVVTGLDMQGFPQSEVCHLPTTANWQDFQRTLTNTTATWQAAEAGNREGYTLADGNWICQLLFKPKVKETFSLATEAEYHMFKMAVADGGKDVLVWAETVWKASKGAQTEANALKNVASEYPNQEPLNADGTPMFESTFDLKDLPELMENEPAASEVKTKRKRLTADHEIMETFMQQEKRRTRSYLKGL